MIMNNDTANNQEISEEDLIQFLHQTVCKDPYLSPPYYIGIDTGEENVDV